MSRSPVTTLKTPAGKNSDITSAMNMLEAGVVSLGFNTTVFPEAIAGAHFQTAITIGIFHGVTAAQTPIGSRRINEVMPRIYSPADFPSKLRAAPAKNRIASVIVGNSLKSVWEIGLPVFSDSIATISSARDSRASAIFKSARWRSAGVVSFHSWKALSAALHARSTSSALDN